jgi:hypothetical protein
MFTVSAMLWLKFRAKLVVNTDQLDSKYIYLIFKAIMDLNMLDIRILVHSNAGRVGAIFMPIS